MCGLFLADVINGAEVLVCIFSPEGMGEVYSALREDVPTRLAEAERVGYGFVLAAQVVPNVPKKRQRRSNRKVPATGIIVNRMKETRGV